MYNADHICRQFAKKYGGSSETLYAPAYAENKEQKNAFYTTRPSNKP
ncbi:transcriptional regulator SorC family [Vibrio astriarenae]|nr:transcriptional regulator SorC family [Vibrio sp. C7]